MWHMAASHSYTGWSNYVAAVPVRIFLANWTYDSVFLSSVWCRMFSLWRSRLILYHRMRYGYINANYEGRIHNSYVQKENQTRYSLWTKAILKNLLIHPIRVVGPPLWSSGQSSWLLTQRSRVRFILYGWLDRLCGLVIRVPGCYARGPGSIPGATRFSE
jgi:hypothetical protein